MDYRDKNTKIIATISDLNCETKFLKQLHESGMDVVRLNSAHQSTQDTLRVIENVRKVSDKIAIMIDTKGPEMRTRDVADPINIRKGEKVILSPKDMPGTIRVTYEGIIKDVPVGTRVLIDDGYLALNVTKKSSDQLVCIAESDGVIKNNKSVNVPNVLINLPSLTAKDKEYLKLAIEHDVDFIAHSFVRSRKDILDIKKAMGKNEIPIIAKIEDQQGVDNLDEILEEVYGVMVARGDMGIEIEAGRVPLIQKEIIRKCIRKGKPVIVATHMLESMMNNPRPTRAEVSDVANAILDGVSALMLSGETSVGKFPIESVQAMSKISLHLKDRMFDERYLTMDGRPKDSITYIAKSAVEIALNTQAKAIVVPSHSGYCARLISSFRPRKPILAPCFDPKVMRRLALSHGIRPTESKFFDSTDEMVYNLINQLKKKSQLKDSDHIVLVAGTPNHPKQRTNFIEVDQVKHILN